MDTRDALIVDTFSSEPLAGTPVGVVPDEPGLDADRRSRIAAELAPAVTAFVDGAAVELAGEPADGPPIHAALAIGAAMAERGEFPADGTHLDVSTGSLAVEATEDGTHRVTVDEPEIRAAEVAAADVARALGVDVAAIRDVAADFPLLRASLGPGVLVVPVNFLEHLSGAEPDPDAVGDILAATGTDSVYAFTFDTLAGDRDAHGLEVDAAGYRNPTGRAEACAAAAIDRHGALDHDRETLRFEAGDLHDRPARLAVSIGDSYTVGGPATTVIEGTLALPPAAGDDDILEA